MPKTLFDHLREAKTLFDHLREDLAQIAPLCSRIVVLEVLRPKNIHYAILGVVPQLGTCVWSLCDMDRDPNDGEPESSSPVPIPAKHLAEGGIIVPDCYSIKEEDFPSPYRVRRDIADKCEEVLGR